MTFWQFPWLHHANSIFRLVRVVRRGGRFDRGNVFLFAASGFLFLFLFEDEGLWGGWGSGIDDSVELPGAPFNTEDSASLLGRVWAFLWENARMS